MTPDKTTNDDLTDPTIDGTECSSDTLPTV